MHKGIPCDKDSVECIHESIRQNSSAINRHHQLQQIGNGHFYRLVGPGIRLLELARQDALGEGFHCDAKSGSRRQAPSDGLQALAFQQSVEGSQRDEGVGSGGPGIHDHGQKGTGVRTHVLVLWDHGDGCHCGFRW